MLIQQNLFSWNTVTSVFHSQLLPWLIPCGELSFCCHFQQKMPCFQYDEAKSFWARENNEMVMVIMVILSKNITWYWMLKHVEKEKLRWIKNGFNDKIYSKPATNQPSNRLTFNGCKKSLGWNSNWLIKRCLFLLLLVAVWYAWTVISAPFNAYWHFWWI